MPAENPQAGGWPATTTIQYQGCFTKKRLKTTKKYHLVSHRDNVNMHYIVLNISKYMYTTVLNVW